MALTTFFNLFDCCSPAATRRRPQQHRRSTIHKDGIASADAPRPPPRINNNPARTLTVPDSNQPYRTQQQNDESLIGAGDAAVGKLGIANNKAAGTYGLLIIGLNMSQPHAGSSSQQNGGGLFAMLECYKPLYFDCDFKHINTMFMLRNDGSVSNPQSLEQYATTTHALLIAWNMDIGLSHTQETINAFLRQYFHKPVPIILYAETKQQPPTPSMTQIQPSQSSPGGGGIATALHAPTSTVGGFSYNSSQVESNAQLQQQQQQPPLPVFRSAPLEDRVHALIDSLVVGTCLLAHKHVTTVVVFDVDMLNEKRLRKCMQWASKQARKTFGYVDVVADVAAAALNNRSPPLRNVTTTTPSQFSQQKAPPLLQPVDTRQSVQSTNAAEQQRSQSLFRGPPPQQSSSAAPLSSRSSSTQTQQDAEQQQKLQQSQRPSTAEQTQTPLNSNIQLRFPPSRAAVVAQQQNTTNASANNSMLMINPAVGRTRSSTSSNVVLALTVPKITDSHVVQRATVESRRQLMQNINTIQRNFKTVLEWAVSEESLNTGIVKELVAIVRGDETDAAGQLEEFPVTLKLEQPAALEFVINVLNGLYTEKNMRQGVS